MNLLKSWLRQLRMTASDKGDNNLMPTHQNQRQLRLAPDLLTQPGSKLSGRLFGSLRSLTALLLNPGFLRCSLIAIGLSSSLDPVVATPIANSICPVGTAPFDIGASKSGGFNGVPTTIGSNAPIGGRLTTPGVTYTIKGVSFKSQAKNQSTTSLNVYPEDNSFSIQQGNRNFGKFSLNQFAFPGDPANNVPPTNNWFYSNGNWFGTGDYTTATSDDVNINGEYLLWQQDVTIPNWVPGNEYVFFAYVTNVIEVPNNDAPSDPIVRLRMGGPDGLPGGTLLSGPVILKESATSYLPPSVASLGVNTANSAPLNGWYRITALITPTSNTVRLKFTSSATGEDGDDFGLTRIGVYRCKPIQNYNIRF